jgi:DNA-binding MarR family transcriptional regulator
MADDWKIHDPHRPLPPLLGELKEAALAELHRRLEDEGHAAIRPGHGCVFRFIDVEGSRLTTIAERANMTKQAVGEVVADLEELDYVERVPDPEDRRAKTIRLTEQGWDAQSAALRIFNDMEQRWAAELGAERIAGLRDTVEAILALEREGVPA